jgi:hypothetical protein
LGSEPGGCGAYHHSVSNDRVILHRKVKTSEVFKISEVSFFFSGQTVNEIKTNNRIWAGIRVFAALFVDGHFDAEGFRGMGDGEWRMIY